MTVTPAHGTRYDSCSSGEILAYTCPISWQRRCLLPKIFSTRLLTLFLTSQWPNQRVTYALNRIRQALSTPDWGPDMLVKLLPDMDLAFFNGGLRTHVQVSWEDEWSVLCSQHPNPTFADNLGTTAFDSVRNVCHIRLNRIRICQDQPNPREAMLQTLIHEMVVSTSSTLPSENVLTVA